MEYMYNLLSIILTGMMSYIIWFLQNYKKSKSADKKALMLLLKNCLRALYKEYTKDGKLTIEEYNDFQELYNAYHDLGGNGTGTRMMEEIDKLRLKGE